MFTAVTAVSGRVPCQPGAAGGCNGCGLARSDGLPMGCQQRCGARGGGHRERARVSPPPLARTPQWRRTCLLVKGVQLRLLGRLQATGELHGAWAANCRAEATLKAPNPEPKDRGASGSSAQGRAKRGERSAWAAARSEVCMTVYKLSSISISPWQPARSPAGSAYRCLSEARHAGGFQARCTMM